MAETLTFRQLYRYDLHEPGITLPVTLIGNGRRAEFNAKVDTGASGCIFARIFGKEIGLDIESEILQKVSAVTGSFTILAHEVTLSVLDVVFETTVYFAEDVNFNRNVLGRQGWLDHIRLGLVDYEGKLYLSDYNDTTEQP